MADRSTASLNEKLDKSASYDDIFEVVRKSVKNTLDTRRAGLALVLAELPNHIGAYHTMGSNSIVVNRTLLNAVKASAKSAREFNSYVYSILMHEYLHSLGMSEEGRVRRLTKKIATENLGADHPATNMAEGSLWTRYPELKKLGPGRMGNDFEVIKDFDRSSISYIA